MNLLLDTHTLLWSLTNDPKLSVAARTAITDPANARYVSPASLIEIALKVRLGKLTLSAPFATLFPAQLAPIQAQLIPITISHIELLTTLPLHHRDPFDRLIAATALTERFTVASI